MKIIILLIFVIFLCFWILLIIWDGLFDDKISGNKAYGVVYWNKVELNWEPSDRLKARLDTSIELYNDNQIQKIIVSGGIGIEWFDEAIVMKDYLLDNWIPETDIITDNQGYTTDKTWENTFTIISDLEDNLENITIVWISQYFHIPRIKLSLKNNGFNNIYWIAPKYFELRDIYSVFREIPAYLKYKFL